MPPRRKTSLPALVKNRVNGRVIRGAFEFAGHRVDRAPATALGECRRYENQVDAPLAGLRTQLCLMLKGAPAFNAQDDTNRVLDNPVAAIKAGAAKVNIDTAIRQAVIST